MQAQICKLPDTLYQLQKMIPLLYQKIVQQGTAIGIKAIEGITAHAPSNQSLTARLVVNELLGSSFEIIKDETGKPIVKDAALHISLSHSSTLAAAIVSEQHQVGIDIETIHPRIERIAHKFLSAQELEAITSNKIETLLLYWSAKEALYKLYAKKQLEFTTQLIVQPFSLQQKGIIKGSIIVPDEEGIFADLDIHYEFLEGHVMAYVLGR